MPRDQKRRGGAFFTYRVCHCIGLQCKALKKDLHKWFYVRQGREEYLHAHTYHKSQPFEGYNSVLFHVFLQPSLLSNISSTPNIFITPKGKPIPISSHSPFAPAPESSNLSISFCLHICLFLILHISAIIQYVAYVLGFIENTVFKDDSCCTMNRYLISLYD